MSEMLQVMENWTGYKPVRGSRRPPDWDHRMAEFVKLVENDHGLAPHAHEFYLREAMGTADFPLLFGDVLDRQLIAAYKSTPQVMKQLCKVGTLRDFRTANRYRMDGADILLSEVAERGEYPEVGVAEARYQITLQKYGKKVDHSWESLINDDLGALSDFPERLGRSAARTEEYLITSQMFDANGPHASWYDGVYGQLALSALPLSMANLRTAMAEMSSYVTPYVDGAGNTAPIETTPKFLLVGPANEILAREIMTSSYKAWTDGTGAAAASHESASLVGSYGLQLVVAKWLPLVATAATGSWMLITDPNDLAAVEFDTLRGSAGPEIWQKSANAVRVGGGEVDPMAGDFDLDTIQYRIRHCMVAARRDHMGIWGSAGA